MTGESISPNWTCGWIPPASARAASFHMLTPTTRHGTAALSLPPIPSCCSVTISRKSTPLNSPTGNPLEAPSHTITLHPRGTLPWVGADPGRLERYGAPAALHRRYQDPLQPDQRTRRAGAGRYPGYRMHLRPAGVHLSPARSRRCRLPRARCERGCQGGAACCSGLAAGKGAGNAIPPAVRRV